jgi:tetratricopeptide (TPR) repeat protein
VSSGREWVGEAPEREEWIDEGRVDGRGTAGAPRGSAGSGSAGGKQRAPKRGHAEIEVEPLAKLTGKDRAKVLEGRVRTGAAAYDNERYIEARRILNPIAEEVPNAASVRELLGLTNYRLGKWKLAIAELEAFGSLGGGYEQHPVLADCYRALRRWSEVERLWLELAEASPSPELVNEGRIVMAGSLADRGRLADGVRLLSKGWRVPRRAKPYHLRRAYALADLQERSGDLPAARATFRWIQGIDPDFVDVAARLEGLR